MGVAYLQSQCPHISHPHPPAAMKIAYILLVAAVLTASSEAGVMRKRFLWKEIVDAANSVGKALTDTFNTAKDAVNKAAAGLNFDKAVDALIPLIHSDMSVTACVATCDASAATVLGPFAPLAHTVCTPLCDGALAKLEEISG